MAEKKKTQLQDLNSEFQESRNCLFTIFIFLIPWAETNSCMLALICMLDIFIVSSRDILSQEKN